MVTSSAQHDLLPDVLQPRLTTVFCGRAPSRESAKQVAYYAHSSNEFWRILAINKSESGSDHELTGAGDDPFAVLAKIRRFSPRILAFNGKNNFRLCRSELCGVALSALVEYGLQLERVDATEIWVLPNTSARARSFWDAQVWQQLATRHFEIQ